MSSLRLIFNPHISKKNRSLSTRVAFPLIVSLSIYLTLFSGCSSKKEELQIPKGPIRNWEDIPLPEDAEWLRSTLSGPGKIENHEYKVDMSETELVIFLEEGMALNAWHLTQAVPGTREYIKEGDRVSINTKPEPESSEWIIVIVIEPNLAYK